ncbi:MAG TPA: hypothetical protein VGE60_10350 [Telluria sp.]
MSISTPARRCLLGLSLGAACAGAAAQPLAALADYSLEQLSDIIVTAAPVAESNRAGSATQSFRASGYPGQPADRAHCVQARRLWSEPAARTVLLVPGALPAPGVPERAH